ncbi:hypothetical protein AZE42_09741 [Rhizopogon vesiculosus]|uniref:Uncharacterized protein n=1 Tax=Rhizopogon vesiculosus TaxID=180088 RepID=A0A1J8Q9N1_9AGAM|nr:hypothetical protein AZE42_09741 [Rhizopogon vesiculosus]
MNPYLHHHSRERLLSQHPAVPLAPLFNDADTSCSLAVRALPSVK